MRIYVLGPPKDLSLIKRDLPSKRDPETYELALAGGLEESFLAAALTRLKEPDSLSMDEEDKINRGRPFDAYYQIEPDRAKNIPFFISRYRLR